jgi:hypothetical protein
VLLWERQGLGHIEPLSGVGVHPIGYAQTPAGADIVIRGCRMLATPLIFDQIRTVL